MLSPSARARLSAPMILAAIMVVAGLAAIVWTVRWSTAGSSIVERVETQDFASLQANRVGDALPVFAVATPTSSAPTAWHNPAWLAVATDEAGGRWVWADAWFACAYIDQTTMQYTLSAEFGETWDRKVWAGLAVQQLAVVEVCHAP